MAIDNPLLIPQIVSGAQTLCMTCLCVQFCNLIQQRISICHIYNFVVHSELCLSQARIDLSSVLPYQFHKPLSVVGPTAVTSVLYDVGTAHELETIVPCNEHEQHSKAAHYQEHLHVFVCMYEALKKRGKGEMNMVRRGRDRGRDS